METKTINSLRTFTPNRQFDDLILSEKTLSLCNELIKEQHGSGVLRSAGFEPENKILLYGDSGDGKTALAEAIACHLMCKSFRISYEYLIEDTIEKTVSNIDEMFEYASDTHYVLFFDDFETILGISKHNQQKDIIIDFLLRKIKELPPWVVVILAVEIASDRLLNMFHLKIYLNSPNCLQSKLFIEKILQRSGMEINIDTAALVKKLEYFSYGKIENFCGRFMKQAVLEHKQDSVIDITQRVNEL